MKKEEGQNQRNRFVDLQLLHPIFHIYDILALHQSNNHHLNSSKQTTSEQSLVPSVASPIILKLFEEPSECFTVPLPTSPACRVAGVINVSMKQVSFTIPGGQIRIVVGNIPLKGRYHHQEQFWSSRGLCYQHYYRPQHVASQIPHVLTNCPSWN